MPMSDTGGLSTSNFRCFKWRSWRDREKDELSKVYSRCILSIPAWKDGKKWLHPFLVCQAEEVIVESRRTSAFLGYATTEVPLA